MDINKDAEGMGMRIMKHRTDLIGVEFSVKNEDEGLAVLVRISADTD